MNKPSTHHKCPDCARPLSRLRDWRLNFLGRVTCPQCAAQIRYTPKMRRVVRIARASFLLSVVFFIAAMTGPAGFQRTALIAALPLVWIAIVLEAYAYLRLEHLLVTDNPSPPCPSRESGNL